MFRRRSPKRRGREKPEPELQTFVDAVNARCRVKQSKDPDENPFEVAERLEQTN